MKRNSPIFLGLAALLLGSFSETLLAADKALGKLFIKAADSAINGQQFSDPELANTIKDMKARHGQFEVVDVETQADFLMVVLERKSEMTSPLGTPVNHRSVSATFSFKDGASWKPGCKLTTGSGVSPGSSWGNAARSVMNEAAKCARANGGR